MTRSPAPTRAPFRRFACQRLPRWLARRRGRRLCSGGCTAGSESSPRGPRAPTVGWIGLPLGRVAPVEETRRRCGEERGGGGRGLLQQLLWERTKRRCFCWRRWVCCVFRGAVVWIYIHDVHCRGRRTRIFKGIRKTAEARYPVQL